MPIWPKRAFLPIGIHLGLFDYETGGSSTYKLFLNEADEEKKADYFAFWHFSIKELEEFLTAFKSSDTRSDALKHYKGIHPTFEEKCVVVHNMLMDKKYLPGYMK